MRTFNSDQASNWFVTLIAIASVTAAGTALADPPPEGAKQVTVSYADLDLSKPGGVQVLYDRIKMAARSVCSHLENRLPEHKMLWRECYEDAVANAIATIDRPTLTALHRASRNASS